MAKTNKWKQWIGNTVDAVRPGGKTAKSHHREASSYLEQGRRLYNKKDYAGAEELFRQAAHADTRYPLAHYYLGLCLYKRDEAEDALKAWQRAIDVGPGSEAAFKADKKIEYARKKMNATIAELESRVRGD
jgi:tetratricopeptide (TPR) repeat protein